MYHSKSMERRRRRGVGIYWSKVWKEKGRTKYGMSLDQRFQRKGREQKRSVEDVRTTWRVRC